MFVIQKSMVIQSMSTEHCVNYACILKSKCPLEGAGETHRAEKRLQLEALKRERERERAESRARTGRASEKTLKREP